MKVKHFFNWSTAKTRICNCKLNMTFDTVQRKVGDIKQIIVGSTNIDASELKTKIKE
jgi:hypothetical protein